MGFKIVILKYDYLISDMTKDARTTELPFEAKGFSTLLQTQGISNKVVALLVLRVGQENVSEQFHT